MKSIIKITILALVLVSFVACQKDSRPNYEYMPNMYEPVGYETYQEASVKVDGKEILKNNMEALLPAEGSISRGYTPFDIENTNEGYELAKTSLVNKLDSTQVNLALGKELYNIYCAICHGNKGKGQGKLVKREKILGIPNYADREITAGSIYHTIYYGKNTMGSYANQLSEEERWQVVAYVEKLRADLIK
ncbi:cytochrome c [uncultured Lacinutrix sp.]|uniref:c-type cytochrome n=1 Tax=uncultured Lacinutrix sp. TaxID=574032 RepID=UPI00261659C5|nr:cytochrome c [uncultured Lacinutrix sp.]